MSKKWIGVGSLVAALAVPVSAWAQQNNTDDPADGPEGSKYEFLLAGTGATTRGDNGNLNQDVMSGSGFIGYYLNEVVELNLRQSAEWLKSKETGSNTRASTRAAIDFHWPLGRIRPFLGVNYGLAYGDGISTSTINVFAPEGGVKFYLRPQTFLMLMAEYQVAFNRFHDFDDNWKDGGYTYTVGMGFNW